MIKFAFTLFFSPIAILFQPLLIQSSTGALPGRSMMIIVLYQHVLNSAVNRINDKSFSLRRRSFYSRPRKKQSLQFCNRITTWKVWNRMRNMERVFENFPRNFHKSIDTITGKFQFHNLMNIIIIIIVRRNNLRIILNICKTSCILYQTEIRDWYLRNVYYYYYYYRLNIIFHEVNDDLFWNLSEVCGLLF